MKTIAIDFDGVIHKYSKGWLDGKIYDEPFDGVFEAIKGFFEEGYSVFIFSTRSPRQIKKWLKNQVGYLCAMYGDADDINWEWNFKPVIIPFWKKFWNKKNSTASAVKPALLGITKRKLPAHIYIDDRALKFDGNWEETLKELNNSIKDR